MKGTEFPLRASKPDEPSMRIGDRLEALKEQVLRLDARHDEGAPLDVWREINALWESLRMEKNCQAQVVAREVKLLWNRILIERTPLDGSVVDITLEAVELLSCLAAAEANPVESRRKPPFVSWTEDLAGRLRLLARRARRESGTTGKS